MPTRTRAASARSPNANRKDSSATGAGSQGPGAAGRAAAGGSTAAPGRARSVGRGVTERQTRGSDDTTSRRSVPAASTVVPEAGRSTTTASTRNSRRSSVTTRDGDRRRATSQPEATTTSASTRTSAAASVREGQPANPAKAATSAAAPSSSTTVGTATSGTTTSTTAAASTTTSGAATSGTATSGTETSGTTTSGTTTSGTTTSGTATTSASRTASASRSPRSPRPHSGAPPTYEESVNHLTLEYGGYFVPYESRPITTPLSNVPSLSFSQMHLAGRGSGGHRGSRNSVGPIGVPADRRLIDERNPRGRRQRRVGDLALTASERVVITEPITRELEEAEEEDNGRCTKLLLPPMHICMATTCLVFNCVIPGSGTLVAAFGLFCCTKPDEWSCGKKMASSCLCLLVALAQIILTPVLLIGWIWSILWGFAYVGVSHQEYHGIKDDDEDEEDELATIASGRGRGGLSDLEDDDTPWALGYHRFDHPTSAPSQRRMSLAATGSQVELERRQASRLRATRSYGYVEVHGLHGGPYGSIDHHRLARTRLQRPPGSEGSCNTLNSNRPMSQTTLTSYINDGMFLNSPPPPQPTRTHPSSMVTIDM